MKNKFLYIGILLVIIDRVSKIIVMNQDIDITIIPYLLSFDYVKNTGVAFSVFAGNYWFILILNIAGLIALIVFFKQSNDQIIRNTLYITMAGAFGNIYDRVVYGYVVDFIDANFFGSIFNLADVWLVCSMVFLVGYIYLKEKKESNDTTNL